MYRIFGRDNCMWCDRAKDLLSQLGLDWHFSNIEKDKGALREFKFYFEGATTVPKIYFEENMVIIKIGGYKELYEWLKPSTKS